MHKNVIVKNKRNINNSKKKRVENNYQERERESACVCVCVCVLGGGGAGGEWRKRMHEPTNSRRTVSQALSMG